MNILRFVAKKARTACTVQGQVTKFFPLNNLYKYLHNDTSETEVNINISANNDSEKL